eukprot:3475129-Prymnesium_polylepis.1
MRPGRRPAVRRRLLARTWRLLARTWRMPSRCYRPSDAGRCRLEGWRERYAANPTERGANHTARERACCTRWETRHRHASCVVLCGVMCAGSVLIPRSA